MRAQVGQSSIEYLALVLLLAAILGLTAVVGAGAGIPQALAVQFARGLCIVRAGDCERDRAPCVVRASTATEGLALRIAVVRLRGGRTVLRERLSDGRVRVSVIARKGLGFGVLLGGGVSVGRLSAGARLEASALMRLGAGRSWTVAGERQADLLLVRLDRRDRRVRPRVGRGGRRRAGPPPDAVLSEGGLDTGLSAGLGRVGVALAIEDLRGVRTDRRTGERTLLLRRRTDLFADASLAGITATGGVSGAEQWALVTQARGRPLDLVVTTVHGLRGGVALPAPLAALAGRAGVRLRGGGLLERERHLDLTDPQNLAVAAAFVRSLRSAAPHRTGAVPSALLRRFARAGTEHVRLYRVERAARRTTGVDAGVGVGLGLTYDRAGEELQLVGAVVRDPVVGERRRTDCTR
ncbi:unannotated protein [freshwater metagenome]|uniref:Unannotated protein n=1 Tax=freshwater metagenome TaxID=449393 RepID=A0A6J7HT91_9ZZZZ|nr:hypothetical protein [Actinomycetota bacterium]